MVYDLVDELARVPEFLGVNHPVEVRRAGSRRQPFLRGVEGLREALGISNGRLPQETSTLLTRGSHRADGLAEEEVCGRVNRQQEEQRLDIEAGAVLGNQLDQPGNMSIHEI